MNYPLLVTIGSLVAGLFGMERWCSWRLNVLRRHHSNGVPSQERTAKAPAPEGTQAPAPAPGTLAQF